MGSLSNYSTLNLLKHILGEAALPSPATVYIALCTADPTPAGTGAAMNEAPNANGYGRKAIAFNAAAARGISQGAVVVMPLTTGGATIITHWAIVDSLGWGTGNMLAYGSMLAPPPTLTLNDMLRFDPGSIQITWNPLGWSDYLTNATLDHLFRGVAYTQPATYVGMVTVAALDSSTGATIVEPVDANYARQLVHATGGAMPQWSPVVLSAASNATDIIFPNSAAAYPANVVGSVMVDNPATGAGNLLMHSNGYDYAVGLGDPIPFFAGTITMTVA